MSPTVSMRGRCAGAAPRIVRRLRAPADPHLLLRVRQIWDIEGRAGFSEARGVEARGRGEAHAEPAPDAIGGDWPARSGYRERANGVSPSRREKVGDRSGEEAGRGIAPAAGDGRRAHGRGGFGRWGWPSGGLRQGRVCGSRPGPENPDDRRDDDPAQPCEEGARR
jgi:hypothetical protein